MARDKGSRRFLNFWLVLAFTIGVAVGALSLNYLRIQQTAWLMVFLGAIAGAIAIFEYLSDASPRRRRSLNHNQQWQRRGRIKFPPAPHRPPASKITPRRGQLRAINGRKAADPPSSGKS